MENFPNKSFGIVHVAPYFEAGNPFGGPLAVAINLVRQLNIDELPSILLAGTKSGEKRIEGIPSKLFKSIRIFNNKKITGLFSLNLIFWIIKNNKNIFLLHIHLARELTTTISALVARFFRIPYVLQTHGMIRIPKNKIEKLFDKIFTKVIIRNAKTVLYLSEGEKIRLQQVEANANFVKFSNSVTAGNPVVNFELKKSEVIFIARLHHNKQPLLFLEVALEIADRFPETKFTIIGPDGGNLKEIINRLSVSNLMNVKYEGSLNPNLINERLRVANIFVLPTLADVFPLALLEAMAAGCAIVTTNACEISNLVTENGIGLVTNPTKTEIQSSIEWLLMNPQKCRIMGKLAENLVISNFDTGVVTKILRSRIYGV